MSCCDHDCQPAESGARYRRILWFALGLNFGMFVVEIVASIVAGSVSLRADALDFLGDAANYAVALAVVGLALHWRARAALLKGSVMGLFGLWALAQGGSLGLLTLVLAFFLYQSAGVAVVQGSLGRRIENLTVADVMDREPITIPSGVTLLDAQEQFFARYHWQWFAVVDPARHFLGVVRGKRVDDEITAGRPALEVSDVLEDDKAFLAVAP